MAPEKLDSGTDYSRWFPKLMQFSESFQNQNRVVGLWGLNWLPAMELNLVSLSLPLNTVNGGRNIVTSDAVWQISLT